MQLNKQGVALINPSGNLEGLPLQNYQNVNLRILLAFLKKSGIPVRLIDADLKKLSPESTVQEIAKGPATIIAVDSLYRTLPFIKALTKCIELSPELHQSVYVLLGIAATSSVDKIIPQYARINAIILGEYENTILELAQALINGDDWYGIHGIAVQSHDGGVLYNSPRKLIGDLDLLPIADRENLKHLDAGTPIDIITSRGCDYNCNYCNIKDIHFSGQDSTWRHRSADNVINELETLVNTQGITSFHFTDHNFFGAGDYGKKRAMEIAENILKRNLKINFSFFCRADAVEEGLFNKLKLAGLRSVNIGFESISQCVLNRLNKGIKVSRNISALSTLQRIGIRIVPSFILFESRTILSEIRNTMLFMYRKGFINFISPTTIIPFENTPLTAELSREGLINSSKYIIYPYINEIVYNDVQVSIFKQYWVSWIERIDQTYNGLYTILARTNQLISERYDLECESRWSMIFQLATEFKKIEYNNVMNTISQIMEGSKKIKHCQVQLYVPEHEKILLIVEKVRCILSNEPGIASVLGAI